MKMKLLPLSLLFAFTSIYSQTNTVKKDNFNQEEYDLFVKGEQHQTVTEGEDAQFTVLLSNAQQHDILVHYKVIANTASLEHDIIVPSVKSFNIPAGKKTATIHIPTVNDGISEGDETFTIEIVEGTNTKTKKKLNNKKLIRTRTISDRDTNSSLVSFYQNNGVIQSTPSANKIEVRNVNGILVDNESLSEGIYFVNAIFDNNTVSKTIAVKY